MKANPNIMDVPEFDDFFRRGEDSTQGADSLQPVADFGADVDFGSDSEFPSHFARTPAQLERRARFVKYVSRSMALLTLCLACIFTYRALQESPHPRLVQVHLEGSSPHRMINEKSGAPRGGPELTDIPTSEVKVAKGAIPSAIAPVQASTVTEVLSAPAIAPKVEAPGTASSQTASGDQRGVTSEKQADRIDVEPKPPIPPLVAVHRSRRVVASGTRLPPANASSPRAVGPKPENYRPPTASFSD